MLFVTKHESLSVIILYIETVVGLEAAAYTVLESEGMVQICVNAVGTNSPCPSTLPFQVSLHISRSTGMYVFVPLLVTLKDIY